MTGELCVYATAWLSLALWAAGEWRRRHPPEDGRGRVLFTAALAAMVLHAALAFALVHGWSHTEALLHAARRTLEVTGTAAPRGFYANHAFLAFWTIEAAAWWLRPDAYRRRPRALAWLSRAVFAFMFVNGAVVFVQGPLRFLGAATLGVVAVAWARGWRRALTMVGAAFLAAPGARAADLLAFWSTPQRGANSFNGAPPDAAYFTALRGAGATWVRLAFGKWPSKERDFLLGSADEYETLVAADLATLRATLDRAHVAGLKVVVTPLSLPGARAKRASDAPFDDRLWSDKKYWRQSAAFWRDLAAELKDHPAVAAYNLINEPVPERKGGLAEAAPADVARAWQAKVSGTARDLPAFYGSLTSAIRAVDPVTPIMVEPGWYASAFAFDYWPAPLADARVLYAFHMYEPWSATGAPNMKRKQPYRYPGRVPYADAESHWDAARIEAFTQQPVDWARRHGLPRSRIVAGELGCMRRWADCPRYLEDVLTALEGDGLHWAFYAFREDVWDGMDYELGEARLPWPYWDAVAQGKPYALPRGPNRVFEPISRRLRQR